jgi:hypothetical protein
MSLLKRWGVIGMVAIVMLALAISTGRATTRQTPDQGSTTPLRELWLTVKGKTGHLSMEQGRAVFRGVAPRETALTTVIEVGPDYVTFDSGGTGPRLVRTVHLTGIDLIVVR